MLKFLILLITLVNIVSSLPLSENVITDVVPIVNVNEINESSEVLNNSTSFDLSYLVLDNTTPRVEATSIENVQKDIHKSGFKIFHVGSWMELFRNFYRRLAEQRDKFFNAFTVFMNTLFSEIIPTSYSD